MFLSFVDHGENLPCRQATQHPYASFEQIVKHDLGLHFARIAISRKAKRCHICEMNGLPGFRLALERNPLVSHRGIVIGSDAIFLLRELHFAQINNTIVSVNHKVNLRTPFRRVLGMFASPGVIERMYAADLKRTLNLLNVFKTYKLKR